METTEAFIERIERRNKYLGNIDIPHTGLFDGPKQFVHTCNLYVSMFKKIPSKIISHNSNVSKLIKKLKKEFGDKIVDYYYMRYSIQRKHEDLFSSVVFVMDNEILIEIELTGEINILFNSNSEEEARNYEKVVRQRVNKKVENKIFMLAQGHFGTDITPLKVKKPVVDLNTNYNNDLAQMHKLLLKMLNKKDNSGLVLLHGKPGTGKSTYIRYLICSLNKKIIFLPPSLATNLDSPALTRTLIDNPNSIFIIEDAEELIKSRESGHSNLSMLLNLTDGILGEALNTHVICTFNTDHKNIDEALLRKGRLLASYKFDDLSSEKLLKLKGKLGLVDIDIKEGMSLADLYHVKENQFGTSTVKKQQIGFSHE